MKNLLALLLCFALTGAMAQEKLLNQKFPPKSGNTVKDSDINTAFKEVYKSVVTAWDTAVYYAPARLVRYKKVDYEKINTAAAGISPAADTIAWVKKAHYFGTRQDNDDDIDFTNLDDAVKEQIRLNGIGDSLHFWKDQETFEDSPGIDWYARKDSVTGKWKRHILLDTTGLGGGSGGGPVDSTIYATKWHVADNYIPYSGTPPGKYMNGSYYSNAFFEFRKQAVSLDDAQMGMVFENGIAYLTAVNYLGSSPKGEGNITVSSEAALAPYVQLFAYDAETTDEQIYFSLRPELNHIEVKGIGPGGSAPSTEFLGFKFTNYNLTYALVNGNTTYDNYVPSIAVLKAAIAAASIGGGSGGDADSLNSQPASYYLNRANHTGSMPTSALSGTVSNSQQATMAGNTIKGNNSGSIASPSDLTASQVKALLSLDNVDNTSDVNKPVSTAQAAAIALKGAITGQAWTGTHTFVTQSASDNSTKAATTAYVDAAVSSFSGSSARETITQSAHGFTAGKILKRSSGTWVTSDNTSSANSSALGVVESVTTNTFVIVYSGKITLSSLTDGADYFLSTSGGYTTTEPTTAGTISKPIFTAISTTTAIVQIQRGIIN